MKILTFYANLSEEFLIDLVLAECSMKQLERFRMSLQAENRTFYYALNLERLELIYKQGCFEPQVFVPCLEEINTLGCYLLERIYERVLQNAFDVNFHFNFIKPESYEFHFGENENQFRLHFCGNYRSLFTPLLKYAHLFLSKK